MNAAFQRNWNAQSLQSRMRKRILIGFPAKDATLRFAFQVTGRQTWFSYSAVASSRLNP